MLEEAMKKLLIAAGLFAATAAAAQTMSTPLPTMAASPSPAEVSAQPRPPRAPGITYDLAVEAAQAAVAACAAMPKNYRTTALVTDSVGVPIALVSGDNAAAITQRIAMGKAQLVVKYRMASSDAVTKARTDKAFADELAANPMIVAARPGGLPIMMGSSFVGSIEISGTPDGHDDDCAKAGLAKIQDRLKTF
jgi:uncharacterized protein GlcG (DUF336 family)